MPFIKAADEHGILADLKSSLLFQLQPYATLDQVRVTINSIVHISISTDRTFILVIRTLLTQIGMKTDLSDWKGRRYVQLGDRVPSRCIHYLQAVHFCSRELYGMRRQLL